MPRRRHKIRGFLRDGLLLLAAGGFSLGSTAVLAQATTPADIPGQLEILKVVLSQLGACTALAVLAWFKHQQVVALVERMVQLEQSHGKQLTDMTAANGLAIANEKQLRIDEQTESRGELGRLYQEAAAERARFLDAHLTLTAQKGKK